MTRHPRHTGILPFRYTPMGKQINAPMASSGGYEVVDTMRRIDKYPNTNTNVGRKAEMFHRPTLVNISRALYRDNPIYRGIVQHMANYIVGHGMHLLPQGPDPEWNRRASDLWRRWWANPEARGQLSGKRLLMAITREMLITGEAWLLYTDTKKLQLLQSEQIVPFFTNADFGVRTTAYGQVTAVNVARINDIGMVSTESARPVAAENIFFSLSLEDPSSVRGIPPAESAFAMLARLDDICDSEAIAWQVLSRMALAVTREKAPEAAYSEASAGSTQYSSDDSEFDITELDYAMIFNANPGDSVHSVDRNLPGKDFPASVKMFLRLIGVAFGMPVEIVLLDWSGLNYSSSRAVLQQSYEIFEDWQTMISEPILTPIYRRKIAEWVSDGSLPLDGFSEDHTWITNPFPWIDPQKEQQAIGTAIDRGITSYTGALMEQGRDHGSMVRQNVADITAAIEASNQVLEKTGVSVPWEFFAGRTPTPSAPAPIAEPETEPTPEPEQPDENADDGDEKQKATEDE
jgi:capsid protein